MPSGGSIVGAAIPSLLSLGCIACSFYFPIFQFSKTVSVADGLASADSKVTWWLTHGTAEARAQAGGGIVSTSTGTTELDFPNNNFCDDQQTFVYVAMIGMALAGLLTFITLCTSCCEVRLAQAILMKIATVAISCSIACVVFVSRLQPCIDSGSDTTIATANAFLALFGSANWQAGFYCQIAANLFAVGTIVATLISYCNRPRVQTTVLRETTVVLMDHRGNSYENQQQQQQQQQQDANHVQFVPSTVSLQEYEGTSKHDESKYANM